MDGKNVACFYETTHVWRLLAFSTLIIITLPISIKKMTSSPNGPLVHSCTPECGLMISRAQVFLIAEHHISVCNRKDTDP